MTEALDLTGSDATALAEAVRSRRTSARELVEASLQRIEQLDPTINAFRVVMAKEALEEANRLDSRTDSDLAMLALAGVPVAIKDDTDVAGHSTMWGTSADRGICTQDAEVVRRLRKAGAIIIGKTNVPELTLWPWTASATWGTTSNPWNSERTSLPSPTRVLSKPAREQSLASVGSSLPGAWRVEPSLQNRSSCQSCVRSEAARAYRKSSFDSQSGVILSPLSVSVTRTTFTRTMTADGPVVRSRAYNQWFVSGHAEVLEVLRSPHVSTSTVIERMLPVAPFSKLGSAALSSFTRWLLVNDPPDHTRLRGVVNRAFSPKRIHAMEPQIREFTDSLLTRLDGVETCDI